MLEKKLTKTLYRVNCPPSETLGEFHLNLLSADEMGKLTIHIDGCPHCQRELNSLKSFMATEPLPYGLSDPTISDPTSSVLRKLIAQLTNSLSGEALAPALRGVEDEMAPRIYQAEEIEIAIEVQEDLVNPGTKMIVGLMLAFDPATPLTAVALETVETQTAEIDQFGNFTLSNLDSGTYDLLFTGQNLEVQIIELTV